MTVVLRIWSFVSNASEVKHHARYLSTVVNILEISSPKELYSPTIQMIIARAAGTFIESKLRTNWTITFKMHRNQFLLNTSNSMIPLKTISCSMLPLDKELNIQVSQMAYNDQIEVSKFVNYHQSCINIIALLEWNARPSQKSLYEGKHPKVRGSTQGSNYSDH